jgi:hypothetical protein
MKNALVAETVRFLRDRGFKPHVVSNRHTKIYFVADGKRKHVTVSNTPSCPFASKKNLAVLRRLLKGRANTRGGNS